MRLIPLMVKKEFAHIRSDKFSIRLMIFPVFAQMLILGYALTTEVKNTPVVICDLDRTPQSASFYTHIIENRLFTFQGFCNDRNTIRQSLDKGIAKIGVVIPEDFSRDLEVKSKASVELLVDGQDANSSNVASGYLQRIASMWSLNRMKKSLAARGIEIENIIPVKVTTSILFNPMLQSTWYMIPALVVLLVTMITSLLTGLSIVKEKEKGTLEQLLVTPVSPSDIIGGKTIPYLVIGIIELTIFLIFATVWFGIPFRGNFLLFIFSGILYMISSLAIGILTSTIARTSQQVLFLIWFILIFFILLSGFFIPIENMPQNVRYITLLNPVRYFMSIVRDLFLKGSGIYELWKELVSMFVLGVSVFVLSVVAFRRKGA